MFGENSLARNSYKVLIVCVVAIGAVPNIMAVFDFIDSMIFLMAVPNVLALFLLVPEVRRDLQVYWQKVQATQL